MMLAFWVVLLIYVTVNSFTECVIPTLSVKKVDSKLIERKRQDTLEICKIFNEENKRLETTNTKDFVSENKKRIKREIDQLGNPILKREDIARVENIVDKLYDDLEESGLKVAYRRRDLVNKTESKVSNITHRRFNFAPAQLFGPLPELSEEEPKKPLQSGSTSIPWIKRWKHGIVPFFIETNTYDSLLAETIIKAFDYIEKVTCIRLQRLRERPTDQLSMQSVEWLYITNPSGVRQCVHSNERKPNRGVQMVVLGYDCLSQGEIAHEIMHILGFSHEHTRPDRDRYITIQWDNIKSGYKKYFQIRQEDPLANLPYDFASVLHYPPRAFSKNGQVTIKTESDIKIGQREALSDLDVEKIGMIYAFECVERNKDYLIKTCPSVARGNSETTEVAEDEIDKYFKDKIWPYGIVNYKIKDKMEFTAEERENIKAVLDHIEKETCIEFRDIGEDINDSDEEKKDENKSNEKNKQREDDNKSSIDNTNETASNESYFELPENNTKLLVSDTDNEVIPKATSEANVKLPVTVPYKSINSSDDNESINILRFKDNKKRVTRRITKRISTTRTKKIRIPIPISPARRHAVNVIVLVRSSKPGCKCPASGRPNGNKVLTISSDCFNSVNDLLHLFVHVLGLDHQHNMHDRNSFLHILWDNLTPEIKEEMNSTLQPAASAGFTYDYQSVMHYPWLQIKDGVTNVMYPVWNDGWAMGHWQGLSWTDVQKLNRIYREECSKRKSEALR